MEDDAGARFACLLRGALRIRGLTQAELGERVGRTQATVSRWLRNQGPPLRAPCLEEIAERLGVDPKDFACVVFGLPPATECLRRLLAAGDDRENFLDRP